MPPKSQVKSTSYSLPGNSFAPSHDGAPPKSASPIGLNTALVLYAVIEFVGIFSAALLAYYFYHSFVLGSHHAQFARSYSLAAVSLATLVLLLSLAFRNFVAIRRQEQHQFVWKGLGAVALAFSIFLALVFFLQLGEQYSRGTFCSKLLQLRCALLRRAYYFIHGCIRPLLDTKSRQDVWP